jgi:hypothetical protein
MKELIEFVKDNWKQIADVIAYVIAGASIVVKLTPTKKDDGILDVVIKFVGKYIALNK